MDRTSAPLRLYVEVARRAFRRYSTYRAATVAGLFTNTVFGFIHAYVLLAVFNQRGDIGGFDGRDVVTFVFLTQGFLAPIGAFGVAEIPARIRSGDVVTDLYRPVDFQLYWLTHDLGRSTYQVLARGVPPFIAGALLFDLRLPSPAAAAAFLAGLVLAVALSFALRFLVDLTAFWLLDIRGPYQLYQIVMGFLAGLVVPVTVFPAWLESVARALPFVGVLQVPIELWLGLPAGGTVVGHLAHQVVWLGVAMLTGRVVLGAAVRRVVIQGG